MALADQPEFLPALDAAHAGPGPHAGLWLPYLFFRPRRFFAHFPRMATGFTIAYSTWILGIGEVVDEISSNLARYELTGRREGVLSLVESWSVYWAVCVGLGAIAAVFIYTVGGWWYRLRIRWSGAANPDRRLSRRVYILASMVYGYPTVLQTAIYSVLYPTPLAADERGPLLVDLGMVVFIFWSVYTSYRGVRSLFDVVRWKARVWFLILPGAFYVIVLGGIAAVFGLLASGVLGEPPDVADPDIHNRPTCRVHYPGNWWIDRRDEDYDPDYSFSIEPRILDAMVLFQIGEGPVDPGEETARYLADYQAGIPGRLTERFSTWGQYAGSGVEYVGRVEGSRYRIRIFTASTASRNVTVVEIAEISIGDRVEPGFALIRRTFVLRD